MFQNFQKFFFQKCIFIFIIIFIIKFFVFYDLDYPKMGGGYIVKFNQFFLYNDPKLLIFISSLFLFLLFQLSI